MSLPDQSAAVPPTVKVNVSQVNPSWQRSSGAIKPSGALRAPPPVAVPTHVTGVVAVGLIVAPDGLDADVLFKPNDAASSASMKLAAIATRRDPRVNLMFCPNLKVL